MALIEIDGLPIKNSESFHGELLVITRWYITIYAGKPCRKSKVFHNMVRLRGPNKYGGLSTNMQTDFALQNAKSFTTNICFFFFFFQCLSHKPGVIMGTHQTRELIGGLKHVVFLKWDGDPIMKHRNCSGECRTWSQKPSESIWT